jgi:hypothetical protein
LYVFLCINALALVATESNLQKAALFSAILSAFLTESKKLLQQDPSDTSVALLLAIAQSQQRMELGIPASNLPTLTGLLHFKPPMSARLVNGMWFTSLALSLSTALVAMLSKEWLTAYLSSRPRPAHAHALLRQSRLEGLDRWWALHIIALLPSLLHLSLLLFSVGLVIYLWTLDAAVAGVIAEVIGITVLFYVGTAVLGAIYDFCPYVTQISGYISIVAAKYLASSHASQDNNSGSYTTAGDLHALLWLSTNARDPAVVDCSYQALAGLRLPPDPPTIYRNPSRGGVVVGSSQLIGVLRQLDEQAPSGSIFLTVCGRFANAMGNREYLAVSSWVKAARYTNVLAGLAGLTGIMYGRNPEDHAIIHVGDNEEMPFGDERESDMIILPWQPSLVS